MTEITKIAILGIIGAVLVFILKEEKSPFALVVGILTATCVFLLVIPQLSAALSYISRLYDVVGKGDPYFAALLKVTGISMLAKISADILKDAGQTAVSSAVKMAGKILCVCLCLPQIGAIFTLFAALLPSW